MSRQPAPAVLAGVRVLDLTRLLPGGYASLLLADLGADVVKVEQPGVGDGTRAAPPFRPDGGSGPHAALHRGKRSVTLDLKHPAGADALRRLAARADVLLESFRPGVLDRLGLGHAVLRAANPRLVHVAISGYGADGADATVAGHDINYLAHAGVLSVDGGPDGQPWPSGVQIADLAGGTLAVVAALAALRAREITGEGRFCDVALADAARSWLLLHAGALGAGGAVPAPHTGTLNGGLACYRTYRCADGRWVAVGALEPRFFGALLDVLGLPELAGAQYDPARQPELADWLATAFAARPRDAWTEAFAGVDACVSPVLDLAEALADPVARDRGAVWDQPHPDGGTAAMPRVAPPLWGDAGRPGAGGSGAGRRGDLRTDVAALGEHTAEVLAEVGYTPADVARLYEAGAV